jgi:hypothetical protein
MHAARAELVAAHFASSYNFPMPEFYIERKLKGGDRLILDRELIGRSGVFVVLAEPGAGKSDLLDFLSESYGITRERGNQFVYREVAAASVLVIDALDEVARIGEDRINEIIVKARASGATTVIFASRSYIWDEARTAAARDCFGSDPTILRLEPFDDDEQRQLFAYYKPSEDFTAFKAEVERFELEPILGNPQFLKLFADAYVEGGRRFSSKKQIYADAVRRLAIECATAAGAAGRPEISLIVAAASEIFAKLLLSGASGITANEEIEGDVYPYLCSIISDTQIADFALNTRLFRSTGAVNRHDPVHRIVAEYCAADYLVKRIEDTGNTFSLGRCLAVLAPNSTVRNELRGLLGWMASLGGRETQEAIVRLDPYAVLANGDASQLHPPVKRLLLERLQSLADIDPFFRRADSWRKFNVAGFFSADIIEQVRPLLSTAHSKTHLLGLLLELLYGTEAGKGLEFEFRAILLNPKAEELDRERAYRNMAAISNSGSLGDFDALVNEATRDSLDIASQMLTKEGVAHFGESRTLAFVKALATLYPPERYPEHRLGSIYFVRQIISGLTLDETLFLLEGITADLSCTCGEVKPHRCTCRRGRSKIAGYLLDRYFELIVGPRDPRQIRRWTERLVFRNHMNADKSASVAAMAQDTGLRRAIQISIVGGLSDIAQIRNTMVNFFMSLTHSGLHFREGDHEALADYALATGNNALWQHLIVTHNPNDTSRQGVNPARARMRAQARSSPDLLRIWTKVNRDHREWVRRENISFGHSRKHYERRKADERASLLARFQQDRTLIETGRHWGWLKALAQRYLHGAHEDDVIIEDKQLIETALLNCFEFLAPHVPSLETMAQQGSGAMLMVLEAACLATFRQTGSLSTVSLEALRVVKAGSIGGSRYQEGEAERFEACIDSRLFASDADKIEYATRLIEPQLTRTGDAATGVPLINHRKTFESVKGALALDWLTRYPDMPWYSLDTLFGIAVTHGDRARLNALIEVRCNEPIVATEDGMRRRDFWLLRHFFFILPTSDAVWAEFSANPRAILQIDQYAGRLARHDNAGWPQLAAGQVFRILDAFVVAWPKVPLPTSWGTGDPDDETAYRFLTEVIFSAGRDDPSNSIPVFDRILSDGKFREFHNAVKSMRAETVRQQALFGFRPQRPPDVSTLLDSNGIASVEDMRALLIELLDELQHRLRGSGTNRTDVFYNGTRRVNENTARNRIVEMLEDRFRSLNLGVVVEHQMIDETRCDFTASTVINASPVVLVTELKGQWNPELFTAASEQLTARYTIYPGAADQGVYLVLWFGGGTTVAGRREPSLTSPDLLRQRILETMPAELAVRIDVYVLDVSRSKRAKKRASKNPKAKKRPAPAAQTKMKAAPKRKAKGKKARSENARKRAPTSKAVPSRAKRKKIARRTVKGAKPKKRIKKQKK